MDATTTVITAPRLGTFEERWDALVAALPIPTPFLTSWWLGSFAGPEACFVLVVEDGELLGGVAFETDTWLGVRRFRMLGQRIIQPDHLDLIAHPDRGGTVEARLGEWLTRNGARFFDLDGLVPDSRLAAILPRPVQNWGETPVPFATLPGTLDEYLEEHSKLRTQVPRARRRLERDGVETRVVGSGDIERALDDLASLHAARWGDESQFLERFEEFRAAVSAGALRNEVVVVELVSHGEVIASEIDFVAGSTMHFYQAGRATDHAWRGSGNVVKAAAIDVACARNLEEYDMLRGDEPYKQDWADDSRRVVHLRSAHGLRARALLAASRVRRRLAKSGGGH